MFHKESDMGEIIREPKQSRSIETKKRIVEAGYELFALKGYFNTNTAEIAKHAGVSTGIVYGYFHDKRDILLDVLDIYVAKVFQPVFDILDGLTNPVEFNELIVKFLDYAVDVHKNNASIHEALHSLVPVDEAVRERFSELEQSMTEHTVASLKQCGVNVDGLTERVHITIDNIQSFAHEVVFDDHEYIDYGKMKTFVIKSLVDIFE